MEAAYKPLYPAEGAPCSGYQCNAKPEECRRVVRTYRGMILHLILAHGVRLQGELFEGNESSSLVDG